MFFSGLYERCIEVLDEESRGSQNRSLNVTKTTDKIPETAIPANHGFMCLKNTGLAWIALSVEKRRYAAIPVYERLNSVDKAAKTISTLLVTGPAESCRDH